PSRQSRGRRGHGDPARPPSPARNRQPRRAPHAGVRLRLQRRWQPGGIPWPACDLARRRQRQHLGDLRPGARRSGSGEDHRLRFLARRGFAFTRREPARRSANPVRRRRLHEPKRRSNRGTRRPTPSHGPRAAFGLCGGTRSRVRGSRLVPAKAPRIRKEPPMTSMRSTLLKLLPIFALAGCKPPPVATPEDAPPAQEAAEETSPAASTKPLPSAEEVLAKAVEAVGGAAEIGAIESYYLESLMRLPAQHLPSTTKLSWPQRALR